MHDYDNFRYVTSTHFIQLTKQENELLKSLIENKGSYVNNYYLMQKLHKKTTKIKTLRTAMSRLRKKLKNEVTIKSRFGLGYYIN